MADVTVISRWGDDRFGFPITYSFHAADLPDA
jgi:hypothetical protein